MKTPYSAYWGKAQRSDGEMPAFHPLSLHCLDVAAVGVVLLEKAAGLRAFLRETFRFDADDALYSWIAFVLAVHDLGKFAEAFQGLRPDVFRLLRQRAPDAGKRYSVRHDSLGWMLWDQCIADKAVEENWFGEDGEGALNGLAWWIRASTGHHGLPPSVSHERWTAHFTNDDQKTVEIFLDDLRQLFPLDGVAKAYETLGEDEFEQISKILSWWLAGLTVLADWIGSNTEFFPYCTEARTLADYWPDARKRADSALKAAGVLPIPSTNRSFADLFPEIHTPSPLQQWAINLPVPTGAQIHLLEDVTGAGKTEAALILAYRMIKAGCGIGFFIALPTMATANAMYVRIAGVYRELFAEHASLMLAHAQRKLVETFAGSILPGSDAEADPAQPDDTATARCNAWIADDNRRAQLAPAGVGTIDQALLAVLYSKHQSLRLLGLFGKVLIVDEVHACDPYMQRVLETVLTFHAMAGGSAILLSATVPDHMKQSLFTAFARGRNASCIPSISSPDFPLASSWYETRPTSPPTPIEARSAVRRTVAVRYVSDERQVLAAIRTALAQGKCVCWIRNTVSDVLAAHAHFAAELDDEHLFVFHARFALGDRLAIEERILAHFGKSSTPALRKGRLVIASQVAEQSLDADWDVMISDLAPIDRLIQRAGRLQRHPRSADGARLSDPRAADERGQACLWVFGPAWTESPSANWFKQAFPKAATVYPHHGQLWLTARALKSGQISMPEDARQLIESVFGREVELPAGLQANANQADGSYFSDLRAAQQNTIKFADGYVRGGFDWWSEAKTPTRLGEPSVTVVLARWDGDQLRPWIDDEHPDRAWANSSVRMAERLIARRASGKTPVREQAIHDLEATLPDKGQWSVLLPLSNTESGWIGEAETHAREGKPGTTCRWRYDRASGLSML